MLRSSEALSLILVAQPSRIINEVVTGAIYWSHTFENAVLIEDVTFDGPVDLSGCIFNGPLVISRCTFMHGLSLANVTVRGTLDLIGVNVRSSSLEGAPSAAEYDAINLSGMVCLSTARLSVCNFESSMAARGLRVSGDLLIQGCYMKGLDCKGSSIGGDLNIGEYELAPAFEDKPGEVRQSSINGSVILAGSKIVGDVVCAGFDLFGSLQFWSASVGGSLFCHSTDQTHTVITGDINLTASKVLGHIQIEGVTIIGKVIAVTISCGAFKIQKERRETAESRSSFVGGIYLSAATVEGWISFGGIVVSGKPNPQRAQTGIALTACYIKGDLSFSNSDVVQGPSEPTSALVSGNIKIEGCTVGGSLNLSNSRVSGVIGVVGSTIAHEIKLSSVCLKHDSPINVTSQARALQLTDTQCGGSCDLSGLRLMGTRSDVNRGAGDGSVEAQGFSVSGTLKLYQKLDGVETWASIPGYANLTRLKAEKLLISGHSFNLQEFDEARIAKEGLILASAEIGELSIPINQGDDASSGFPVPLDLSDIKVRRWDIFDQRNFNNADRVKQFKGLLSNDWRFQRSTYRAVEQHLRNSGHEEDANAIYRAMMARVERQEISSARRRLSANSSFAKRFSSALWLIALKVVLLPRRLIFGNLLGYGSRPLPLLALVFGLWIVCLPIYIEKRNFEPSVAALSAGRDIYIPRQTPSEWGLSSAIAISLRFHVPVINLLVREAWKPREIGPLYVNLESLWGPSKQTIPFLTPEDFLIFISLANWMMWPLLLTFAFRKAFRQSQ